MMTVYLCGWLITAIATLAAADRLSSGDSPPMRVCVGVGGIGAIGGDHAHCAAVENRSGSPLWSAVVDTT